MVKTSSLVVVPKRCPMDLGSSARAMFLAALVEAVVERGTLRASGDNDSNLWLEVSPDAIADAWPWLSESHVRNLLVWARREGLISSTRQGNQSGGVGAGYTLVGVNMDALRDRSNELWDCWVLQWEAKIEKLRKQEEERP